VPPTMPLTLWSGDRSIHVSGIQAPVDAETLGGDISVDHVTGTVTARTSSGDIHLSHLLGDVTAHTDGGNILASAHQGSLALSTDGGDIDVSGSLTGASQVKTGGGTLDVSIPANSRLDIQAESATGPAWNDFGLPIDTQGGHSIGFSGRLGDGSLGTLEMTDAAGPIALHSELP
jgi:DUF4097 and DUF4098 domain-containing protein YvlB